MGITKSTILIKHGYNSTKSRNTKDLSEGKNNTEIPKKTAKR
jgi:hypothetical protein